MVGEECGYLLHRVSVLGLGLKSDKFLACQGGTVQYVPWCTGTRYGTKYSTVLYQVCTRYGTGTTGGSVPYYIPTYCTRTLAFYFNKRRPYEFRGKHHRDQAQLQSVSAGTRYKIRRNGFHGTKRHLNRLT
jgi:hypothetical protein